MCVCKSVLVTHDLFFPQVHSISDVHLNFVWIRGPGGYCDDPTISFSLFLPQFPLSSTSKIVLLPQRLLEYCEAERYLVI